MENRNGRGIFLGVVSVATLIVAIIGATFAYFSASVSSNEGDINGATLDVSSSALALTVTKLNVGGQLSGARANLVPAVMTETKDGYAAAVSQHCENAGYTGCHVYEIHIDAENAVASADLLADLELTPTTNEDQNWKYALLQTSSTSTAATSGTAPTLTSLIGTAHAFGSEITMVDDAPIAAGDTYYYLVVYLLNIESSQNGVTGDGSNVEDATGSYAGTVTLKAAGGQVKATFSTT